MGKGGMWKAVFSISEDEEAEQRRVRQEQLEREEAHRNEVEQRRLQQQRAAEQQHYHAQQEQAQPADERDYSQWRSREEEESDDVVSRALARRLQLAEEEQRRTKAAEEKKNAREMRVMGVEGPLPLAQASSPQACLFPDTRTHAAAHPAQVAHHTIGHTGAV